MIDKISIRQTLKYEEVLNLQISEFTKRVECRKNGVTLPGDTVFFVEHFPVYTIGKHGKMSNLLLSAEEMDKKNIEWCKTGRGGDITYHGPGQLTVYPVIDLMRYHLGVKDYVHLLEETVIRTLKEFGIRGERIEGKTGVWIDAFTPKERKICAIGIKCSRHVSMHGFALNVGSDLKDFSGIVPCGLSAGVTSISKETGREVSLDEVEPVLWENLTYLLQLRIPSQGNS